MNSVYKMALVGLASVALGVAGSAKVALAQAIKYEVRVKGYSSAGWIEVREDVGGGGAVIRRGGRAFTDRVARGEQLRVTITDRGAKKCEVKETIVGVVADNGFVQGAIVSLPFRRTFKVSDDASFDKVTSIVANVGSSNVVTRRVPIGIRPSKD